jgi:hypothetical protein
MGSRSGSVTAPSVQMYSTSSWTMLLTKESTASQFTKKNAPVLIQLSLRSHQWSKTINNIYFAPSVKRICNVRAFCHLSSVWTRIRQISMGERNSRLSVSVRTSEQITLPSHP